MPPAPPKDKPNNALDPDAIPRVHFHDGQILRAAGNTPEAVQSLLRTFDQPSPSRNAIQQWQSRNYIPDRWRAVLVYALLASKKITTDRLFRKGDYRPGRVK